MLGRDPHKVTGVESHASESITWVRGDDQSRQWGLGEARHFPSGIRRTRQWTRAGTGDKSDRVDPLPFSGLSPLGGNTVRGPCLQKATHS